ncbi:adenosylcobinamide-phosphate synthase CbiB [Aliikangiella sp. G2MR2-5]|uniref:adenosylcobinamide-phosphate synthase CbiB n=1 Tax=Aliikangiella sp. G2MR2-5 TaxID=2788943 RepID=UPI0018A91BD8|nr:adenosylcobinamide-phosphate synthase CbiB [Aliikangiella sp. G2MR2-5]
MIIFIIPALALLLDRILGEPRKYHPLVGFGILASKLEKNLNKEAKNTRLKRASGIFAWGILCLPLPLVAYFLQLYLFMFSELIGVIFSSVLLYLAIGMNSLNEHAMAVYSRLSEDNIDGARKAVSMMVSRKCEALQSEEISRATIESVLENGHDAVIGSLFWFMIGGVPLVILHRLVNTLDAMWGYRNSRFKSFGWFAAKFDDLMGWPSAKLTAMLYLVAGKVRHLKFFIRLAAVQARQYKSLNGGWAMSAGASALNICLGGNAVYHGKEIMSPALGRGDNPVVLHIKKACKLVEKAAWLSAFLCFVYGVAGGSLLWH